MLGLSVKVSWEETTRLFTEKYYIWGGKIQCLNTHDLKGYFDKSSGYMRFGFNGKNWLQHRLIYLITYGSLPDYDLDHIDRDKLNNRPENLRPSDRKHNVVNSAIRCDNTTGYRGVINHKLVKGWTVQGSTIEGKRKHLGTFNCIREAALAYDYHALATYGHLFAEFNKVFEDTTTNKLENN